MAQGSEIEETAFYDSGMIVALARGPADLHYQGVAWLDAFAERNEWRVITSRLVLMEAASVVRRRTTMSHRYRSGSGEERASVDADVRRADADLLDAVSAMEDQGRITVMDLAGWPPNLALLHAKMWEHPGYTAPGARGQTCRHRGIGPHDWLHLDFAARAEATIVCTTDAALADIAGNDAEFGHIRILLAGDPPPPHPFPPASAP